MAKGAPVLTCGYLGIKNTASTTVLTHGCLQPTKPCLETALVYAAMAQTAGAETEPSIAPSLYSLPWLACESHFPDVVYRPDVVYEHALLFLNYLSLKLRTVFFEGQMQFQGQPGCLKSGEMSFWGHSRLSLLFLGVFLKGSVFSSLCRPNIPSFPPQVLFTEKDSLDLQFWLLTYVYHFEVR